jgi:hypothetical protein
MDSGITSRPAPLRDGNRRYEGFAIAGRNIVYAHIRKSMILIDFNLPAQAGYPQARVRHGGGREWFAIPVTSENDFETALELATLTVARARGGEA